MRYAGSSELNRLLEERGFAGLYFRLLLIGYFEGIDGERGIAWRAADLRNFLGVGLNEMPPDDPTISRTRADRCGDASGGVLLGAGVIGGEGTKTVGIDATTLEANAAMRSIVRRDTGEGYEEFLLRLAQESGIATPTRASSWRSWIGSVAVRVRMQIR